MRQAGACVRAREVKGDGSLFRLTFVHGLVPSSTFPPSNPLFAAKLPCYWSSTPVTVARPTGKGEESREGPRVAPFLSC